MKSSSAFVYLCYSSKQDNQVGKRVKDENQMIQFVLSENLCVKIREREIQQMWKVNGYVHERKNM